MKKLVIEGGRTLTGEVRISGAKNSVVALIPATILTKGKCVIENVPNISDVTILIKMLEKLGSKVTFENEVLTIDNKDVKNQLIDEEYASKIRASYYFMGSLLGRFGEASIAYPGGCIIGSRPIDFHLNAFKKMGVNIVDNDGNYELTTNHLHGIDIFFDFPSVGATINVMIAAVLAKGKTTITNAACEPEITNVASFLNSMGAKISGAGTSRITIEGVTELGDGYVEVIPDRIEAGTYLIIGALLGKDFSVAPIVEDHLGSILYKLRESGVDFVLKDHKITLSAPEHLKPVNIKTTVFPGFPTDLGQPMSTFLTQCEGESLFEETIYENRLRHVPYLNNMGANIKAFDQKAIITGKTPLKGRKVKATDLRAGASMLVAGMIASGTTTITNIEHLLRGYERIVDKLDTVGASIQLIDEEDE